MKPLFMWAGGKTRLLKKYKERDVMPESFDTYVEPFMGAGAMFVWAYEQNPNAQFVLSDYNPCIMNIYKAIRDDHNVFVERMDKLSAQYLLLGDPPYKLPLEKAARKEFYYNLRTEHAFDYEKWNQTEEAATLYFLMKTGFNGIWQINKNTGGRFGTPSGLLNQKDKVYDKDNVHEWHLALQHCKLMTGDFGETIGEVKENSFVFLDPPYRGSFTQYGVDFDDEMQNRVISFLNDSTNAGAYVIMSNRDVGDGFFESRQGNNRLIYFDVTYTAGRRKKNADGTHSAKKAREILMIGEQNGTKSQN